MCKRANGYVSQPADICDNLNPVRQIAGGASAGAVVGLAVGAFDLTLGVATLALSEAEGALPQI